jgi:hypothetical protein
MSVAFHVANPEIPSIENPISRVDIMALSCARKPIRKANRVESSELPVMGMRQSGKGVVR